MYMVAGDDAFFDERVPLHSKRDSTLENVVTNAKRRTTASARHPRYFASFIILFDA
jgi:hypothetical protein